MKLFSMLLTLALFGLVGCTKQTAQLGSKENPIKFHFVPSVDAKVLEANSKEFLKYLEANTPYKYELSVPQSYVAVVESFGTKKADIAALNSFGYLMAHDKYGAEARLVVLRHGSATYQSQFIVKNDSSIKKLEDLGGKKIAFVDPSSTSGYLLPMKTLKDKKIEPKETIFSMKHDSVVTKVYLGEVDAGATFYSPPTDGKMEDARRLVLTQYPDVESKVKILDLSDPIPNDPIVFRKDMPEDMKKKITDVLMKFISTDDGKRAFREMYGVTDLKVTTDAEYEPVRKLLTSIGKSAQDFLVK
ncbi:MAG: phosphate/phosphite/phosphonate ABC transporter substrate-binding protein [Bdellovibrionaceae bacterium]|nr:phosphate/phosphite/phosphonate ABC transporter substrate-binding protein [Pseudobdellovibrionaceae bacterium]NUM57438.1 phosphate/phosphite/phosphonate ABC transporter substrate-binding protein [Pseudobdellovibrionaceae bacterium]